VGFGSLCESRNRRDGRPILEDVMRGIITTKHLVTSAPTIISEFGVAAYVRCWTRLMLSRREVTFLECVCQVRRAL
jgi:hypothetical protein